MDCPQNGTGVLKGLIPARYFSLALVLVLPLMVLAIHARGFQCGHYDGFPVSPPASTHLVLHFPVLGAIWGTKDLVLEWCIPKIGTAVLHKGLMQAGGLSHRGGCDRFGALVSSERR